MNQPTSGLKEDQVAWYRRYWWFAVIFLILPFGLFAGIAILLTDPVYKKDKETKLYGPISDREKTALIVVAVLMFTLSSSTVLKDYIFSGSGGI